MEHRVEEELVVESLGFPVRLRNVPMRKFRGEWEPDINWNDLQHVVLWALAHKPTPLTGDEVRFVRHFMECTLQEFAELCAVGTHPTVMNWESKGARPTGMHRSTEIVLRARILEILPDELWNRFDGEPHSPREIFARRLHEVSEFGRQDDEPPLEVVADDAASAQLRYAYA